MNSLLRGDDLKMIVDGDISRVDNVDNFMRLFGIRSSGAVQHCNSRQLIDDVERLLGNRKTFQKDVTE